jgi:DNA primase
MATVSMPVEWDELESVYPTDFTLRRVPELLEERGDPWADILSAKQDLTELLEGAK